jgi:SAM-dependent methyltransferase
MDVCRSRGADPGMKLFYELGYRCFRMPWETGPRPELVQVVETGRVRPCRSVDLGCGSGANAVFLAQHGFRVTAVDLASSAIARARQRAQAANVAIDFVVDDLVQPRRLVGPFDFLVDYGTFDDLDARGRARYVANVVPLAGPDSAFPLWCFEWSMRWWEGWIPFFPPPLAPGEAERHFGADFTVERPARGLGLVPVASRVGRVLAAASSGGRLGECCRGE